jgi:hypothetical protein
VATSGLAISRLFARLERSFLFSFTGSRARLIGLRLAVYVTAALTSVGVCGILFLALPGFVAMATFFAFEAIILDVCSQRIEYVRAPESALARHAACASQHGTVTGAF